MESKNNGYICIYIVSLECKAEYDFETTDFAKKKLALYSNKYSTFHVLGGHLASENAMV